MTNDLPFETSIFPFLSKYSQKIFFGYKIVQLPFSVFSLIFWIKLKFIFLVFLSLFITSILIEASTGKIWKKKND